MSKRDLLHLANSVYSAFIGLSFRVAQMLGLHKDPSRFKSLDPISAEVRRRIWWHVVHLDVSIAVASGLPPIIDLHCWDVQKPSELKDEYIGTAGGEQYDKSVAAGMRYPDRADDPDDISGSSMVSTGGILAGGKLSSTCKPFLQRRQRHPRLIRFRRDAKSTRQTVWQDLSVYGRPVGYEGVVSRYDSGSGIKN